MSVAGDWVKLRDAVGCGSRLSKGRFARVYSEKKEPGMKRAWTYLLLAVVFAGPLGCVTNPIVGHGAVHTGRYTGDVGITGNGTNLTVQAGSNVPKLSIVGDACSVNVEDGAVVRRIEFWGTANTVTIPENLDPIVASMGVNHVVRRSVAEAAPVQAEPATRPAAK
jgi:hypothetical protein